jgi:RimJ/RimL family protein N-acetyltransferase
VGWGFRPSPAGCEPIVNDMAEPLRPARVLAQPKRWGPLKSFSCGRKGMPWETMVNVWVKDLFRGIEADQTVVVLEDANRRLIGICSFMPQPVVGGTFVGKDAHRVHMLGIDRLYQGKRLSDGSRASDILLQGALEQIRIVGGGRMPCVSALVAPENHRSHALFERHGFRQVRHVGEGEVICLRLPDKRLSLLRLKLLRASG